jgi:hypothetical protein
MTDVAENFNPPEEFHQHLAELNSVYGRGDITAIVWDAQPHSLSGTCITQLQYGQSRFTFRVKLHLNGYTLKALGRSQSRVSDYFA